MSVPPVRIGLVGYGKGGRLFHAPLIGHAEGCVLGGVVVRSPERRAALATNLPDVPVAATLAELADTGVDAVVITTPLDSHGCQSCATNPSPLTQRWRGRPYSPPSAPASC